MSWSSCWLHYFGHSIQTHDPLKYAPHPNLELSVNNCKVSSHNQSLPTMLKEPLNSLRNPNHTFASSFKPEDTRMKWKGFDAPAIAE